MSTGRGGADRHPTLTELLQGAIRTIEDVLLPDLSTPHARSQAIGLAGQLRYAVARSEGDDLDAQTDALEACLNDLCAASDALRAAASAAPVTGDRARDVRERAGRLLVYAVEASDAPDGPDAAAVRERLRPLLLEQLQQDLATTTPMLHAFLAAGSVGSAR